MVGVGEVLPISVTMSDSARHRSTWEALFEEEGGVDLGGEIDINVQLR